MIATAAEQTNRDPYYLDPAAVKEPPEGWRSSLQYLGPGLILSASIVGSGELIATTTAGAQAGFVDPVARAPQLRGQGGGTDRVRALDDRDGDAAALSGLQPGAAASRDGSAGSTVLFVVMVISKVLQVGGIVGGTAIAFSVLFPLGGDPLTDPSRTIWHVILITGTILLLHRSSYRFIERGAFLMVVTLLGRDGRHRVRPAASRRGGTRLPTCGAA